MDLRKYYLAHISVSYIVILRKHNIKKMVCLCY